MIKEEEPPKPSTRLSDSGEALASISANRHTEPAKLTKLVRGELDWIVMKTLEKDRNRRYETANAFAADVQRYLNDETVQACPPSATYRLKKLLRRNKGPVLAAAVVVLALVGGIIGTTWGLIRATEAQADALWEAQQKERALDQAGRERGNAKQLAELRRQELLQSRVAEGVRLMDSNDLFGSLPWFAEALRLEAESEVPNLNREKVHRVRLAAVLRQCPRLVQLWSHDEVSTHAEFSPDGRRVVTACFGGTDGEKGYAQIWDVFTGEPRGPRFTNGVGVLYASFSPDGTRVVTADRWLPGARVWDAATSQPITDLLRHRSSVNHASFSPDGARVVTASNDGTARVWNAASGQPVGPPLKHRANVWKAIFSPEGNRVLTAGGDFDQTGYAQVWDAVTGQPIGGALEHRQGVPHASFSPDGRKVVTASWDGTAKIWDVIREQARPEKALTLIHSLPVRHVAFSPEGGRVATASGAWGKRDGEARVWNATTGQPITPPLKHGHRVEHVAFSPDGRLLITASIDGTARLWDAATGVPAAPPLRHPNTVTMASFRPDGRLVMTASSDSIVRVWELTDERIASIALKHAGAVRHVSFSRDGRRMVTGSEDNTARIWDAFTGSAVTPPLRHNSPVDQADLSPDGRLLVTVTRGPRREARGDAQIWDTSTVQRVGTPLQHDVGVWHAVFSPDGKRLVTAGGDGKVKLWEVATGRESLRLQHTTRNERRWVWHVSFSPDGSRLVTACQDRSARVWDARTGEPITPFLTHSEAVYRAWFSPDGRRVLTASNDGTARVWDAGTGKPVTAPLRHNGPVLRARFSPDGRRVVTASEDNSARIWDADSGQPITPPLQHDQAVLDAEFSPEGGLVATVSNDQTARVWDATNGAPVTPPLRHAGPVVQAAFSPDGRRLATACSDMAARLWKLEPVTAPPEDLVRLAQLCSGHRVDPTTGVVPIESRALTELWQSLRASYPHLAVGEWGSWYRRQRELDKTIAGYRQDIAFKSNDAKPHHGLGVALGQKGDLEGAVAAFRNAVTLDPKHAQARHDLGLAQTRLAFFYRDRGMACLRARGWEAAKAFYDKYLKLCEEADETEPSSLRKGNLAWAYRDMGDLYLLWEKPAAARDYYLKNLKLRMELSAADPGDLDAKARMAQAKWYLGLASLQLGDAAAVEYSREHLELTKGLADAKHRWGDAWHLSKAHDDLAWCLATLPDPKVRDAGRAVELAQKAVELAPADGNWRKTLGAALYRAGDWQAAAKALATSMEWRNGGDSFDGFFLAMAHWQLGDKEKARERYEQAVQWMDNNKPADALLLHFRAEAAALMGIPQETAPRKEPEPPDKMKQN